MPKKRSKLGVRSPSKRPRKTPSKVKSRSAGPSAKISQTPSDDKAVSAGSSTKLPHNTPSHVEATVVDPLLVPRSTGREFPNGALSALINGLSNLRSMEGNQWLDNGEDIHLDSILHMVLIVVPTLKLFQEGCPESLLEDWKQLEKNMDVVKNSDPDFINLLRQVVKDNNEELWGRVLMHDVFHTVIM